MRAALFDPTVEPPTLRLVEVAERPVGRDEIRIDVRAVPMSTFWLERSSTPFVPGWVMAGWIVEVGDRVGRFAVGQRVVAMQRAPGLAESVTVAAIAAAAIPDDVRFDQAVAVAAGVKASMVVEELGNRMRSDTEPPSIAVLHDGSFFASITAGLLREAGAVVIGGARAPVSVTDQLAIRFTHAFELDREPFEVGIERLTDGRGVDAVIDHLGIVSPDEVRHLLRRGGCLLRCDPSRTPLPSPSEEVRRLIDERGFTTLDFTGAEAAARQIEDLPRHHSTLMTAVARGAVVLNTTAVSFEDVEHVPDLLRRRDFHGSLIVTR